MRPARGRGHRSVGPVAESMAAESLLETMSVDAGILDIRLQDGLCFRVARTLKERRIPFFFLTGSTGEVLPEQLRAVPTLNKPAEPLVLLNLLHKQLTGNVIS